MNGMHWEPIGNNESRARVPGGWVLKVCENVMQTIRDNEMADGYDWRVAITFIPDPKHHWDVDRFSSASRILEEKEARKRPKPDRRPEMDV